MNSKTFRGEVWNNIDPKVLADIARANTEDEVERLVNAVS